MCQEIKKLDFDIALLGCGGYGLPLCNFIKKDMDKSHYIVEDYNHYLGNWCLMGKS